MGWCGGSELAEEVWSCVRTLIPASDARTIAARKIIYYFEQCDCDTMPEATELCEDAGLVYDEENGESVYTPLRNSRVGCDLGVPCRDCPKASTAFQRLTALDAAVAQCRACPLTDCRDCGATEREFNCSPAAARTIEEVGNLIAAEALRRAVQPKSAADLMRDAGMPNMLEGRPLNINLGATDGLQ
jgi:hypothetical protein